MKQKLQPIKLTQELMSSDDIVRILGGFSEAEDYSYPEISCNVIGCKPGCVGGCINGQKTGTCDSCKDGCKDGCKGSCQTKKKG